MAWKKPVPSLDPDIPDDVLERLSAVEQNHAGFTRIPEPSISLTTAVPLNEVIVVLERKGIPTDKIQVIVGELRSTAVVVPAPLARTH